MKRNNKPFIGITGSNASGKGEVIHYLQAHGYTALSLSDILRDILRETSLPEDRKHLTEVGQAQRNLHGPGFLATRAIESNISPALCQDPTTSFVIDSIRHPEEVRILQESLHGFELWLIDADPQIRFERSQKRGRQENASTLQAFIEQENQEKTNNPNAQQLHNTAELATHKINNDTTLQALHQKIDDLL